MRDNQPALAGLLTKSGAERRERSKGRAARSQYHCTCVARDPRAIGRLKAKYNNREAVIDEAVRRLKARQS